MGQLAQKRQVKPMGNTKTIRKSKREIVEDKAYMILSDIAFDYKKVDDKIFLRATNLNTLRHEAFFVARDNDFMYFKSNMSKEIIYKVMYIVEKNKEMLLGGLRCHTIQETK